MPKWIKLNNDVLINLDITFSINKYKRKMYEKQCYSILYNVDMSDSGYVEERFDNKEDRDKRFEEIKAMLIGNF